MVSVQSPDGNLRDRLRLLKTADDVSTLLGVDKSKLIYHLYLLPSGKRYTVFEIPKRSGGKREIKAPVSALKIIQRRLNEVLQQVYRPRATTHCFIRGENIVKNARVHVGKKWVFNIDLKDFFPTITFPRVRGLFINKPYLIEDAAATVLAQICCDDSKLPQGAPTSPIISNMICSKLDNELNRLAKKYDCICTRYADDITFSKSGHDFPEAVAVTDSNGITEVGEELKTIIKQNWFEVNMDKVRLFRNNVRQQVTGLIVNKKLNVKRRYVRQVRAMLHAWERDGLEEAGKNFFERHYHKHRISLKGSPSYKHIINGKLGFMKMVLGKENQVFKRYYFQYKRLCLLDIYEVLEKLRDRQKRGYLLQDLLIHMFELYEIEATPSFTRSNGGEQIDGGFELDGGHFIVECRWRAKVARIREVDGLYGQIGRSGASTKGLFLSINGWSGHVQELIKQNTSKNIILMNGNDIQCVLRKRINLKEFIKAKLQHLNLRGEPYCGEEAYLASTNKK